MSKFTTKQLVTLAVFGALWGIVEMSLGSVLNALKVPLSGAVLTAIGLSVAMVARLYVPKRGSTLFIGIIAMVLKLFSIGSVIIGPMVGILAAAIIAELVLSAFPRPSRAAFMTAGSMGVLWTLIQPFFMGLVVFGRGIVDIWMGVINEGSRLLGVDSSAAVWILLLLVLLRIMIGTAAALLAWSAGRLLKTRLQGTAAQASQL
jgi:hypothetical protein